MEQKTQSVKANGIRFSVNDNGKEIGRAYLYIMNNDLHDQPFGLLEDVFIDDGYRSKGIASHLVQDILKTAKDKQCYKLIATSRMSRPKVHELYKHLGFKERGYEFRVDFV